MPVSAYTKAIASFLATLAAAFVAANTDGHVDGLELQQLVVLALASAGVVLVPVLPGTVGRYSKQVVAFLGAAAVAATPLFHGVYDDLNVWLIAVLAGLQAVGVAALPNDGYQPRHAAPALFRHSVPVDRGETQGGFLVVTGTALAVLFVLVALLTAAHHLGR